MKHTVVYKFFFGCMFLLISTACGAATIKLTYDVTMNWRYDLARNDFDYSFGHPTFRILATIDDGVTNRSGTPGASRISFGSTTISSPLVSLVYLGVDPSSLFESGSQTNVQDTFITESNQGTWTHISQSFSSSTGELSRWLQYTSDPRLLDPAHFGSGEFFGLLKSQIGKTYGYREDSSFFGGGFQHNGSAVLLDVSRDQAEVPEPGSWTILALSFFGLVVARRPRSRGYHRMSR